MRRVVTAIGLMVAVALTFAGCEDGDWLGPVERALRSGVNGWDMWATDAVRPYEEAMPPVVEGTVPTGVRHTLAAGREEIEGLDAEQRAARAALTYRRYCHHCHGPNGDGRIIVGESLELRPADLRRSDIQSKTDEQLFAHLKGGGMLMLPLYATMTPAEMLLAIEAMRSLSGKASTPYYPPRNSEPIR